MYKHPFEERSLSPLGLTTPHAHKRLQYVSTTKFRVDEERLAARFWEKRNRIDAPRPLPIEDIVHRVLPSMAQANRIMQGDFVFDGKPYLTRDIVTLAAVVQWFGSNVGRCFIDEPLRNPGKGYHPSREFMIKFAKENKDRDVYVFFAHRCTASCDKDPNICTHDARSVTDRDRVVIDGLMWWLGSARGRQFLDDYRARRKAAHDAADARRTGYFERRRQKQKAA